MYFFPNYFNKRYFFSFDYKYFPVAGSAPSWDLLELNQTEMEYDLFDSVITEFTEISGFPIHYYVKIESDVTDAIYGEDTNAEYTIAYKTKLVYKPTDETDILNSFGITSDDTIQYMEIPKTLFTNDVKNRYLVDNPTETELTPKVGDCIRTLWNNKLYEISDVGSEEKIFQGKKYVWNFVAKAYRHAEESDSADDMLYEEPPDTEFPDINFTTSTEKLSAYGDNEEIEELSDFDDDPDTSIYGF